MSYTAWDNGFGSWTGAKWHPGLTSIPDALVTGNFDLRTHCRVTRVLSNADGRAVGVEYVDRRGRVHDQRAETVILCSYTWENLRLMFLSADGKHPDGLGNSTGQLGKHLMIKMFAHVDGYFPDDVFNRHTGPAAQGVVVDDYLCADFDSWAAGEFLGGLTLGAENQFLPIQIARESLPDDVPGWGLAYKKHLQEWQHLGVVRAQPEALSYVSNYVDVDPRRRDKSGLGMPVMRVTYDLRENERRIAQFFHGKAEEILKTMGATKTWNGPDFTGVGSSHDLGGARMSDDPAAGVLDRTLRVHDTPGLYLFGGAAMPTCPGINPTLTLWTLCYKAAEDLVDRLKAGDER
jgi:gluconate 2-dehydrogenase alpha chain